MASRPLRPGTVIAGKYRLLERLGGGGMGDVYRAEHELAGRLVALKLLKSDYADDPDLTSRFFQEAQAVNRIRHPNIVDVLDAGFSELGPYVVMECLEGVSLSAALVTFGRLDALTTVSIALPVLDALGAAHRNGIVHRDLKPENIFLARNVAPPPASGVGVRRAPWDDPGPPWSQRAGSPRASPPPHEVVVKILDFGIAKITAPGQNVAGRENTAGPRSRPRTHTGMVFGTPDYLSPEQARGDTSLDGRSDIFSLGIVLFELLTGQRPFSAEGAVATAYRIVHEPAPRLVDLGIQADPLLQIALDTALAKAPHERFATAAAFADMLAPLAPDLDVRRDALRRCAEGTVAHMKTDAPPIAVTGGPAPPLRLSQRPTRRPAPTELASAARLAEEIRVAPLPPIVPTLPSAQAPIPAPAPERQDAREPARDRVWLPRPLPELVRHRCHVRGSLSRAVLRAVERTYGPAALGEILRLLRPEHGEPLRAHDAIDPAAWYPLEPVDLFLEAGAVVLMGGDATAWRELARNHFARALGDVFPSGEPTRGGAPPPALEGGRSIAERRMRQAPMAWRRLLSFGAMRITENSPNGAAVRVQAFDAASLALRSAVVGSLEGVVRAAGIKDVEATIEAGNESFAPVFAFRVRWASPPAEP